MLQDAVALWCRFGLLWGLGLVAAQGGHPWFGFRSGCRVQGSVKPWWSADLAPEPPPLA